MRINARTLDQFRSILDHWHLAPTRISQILHSLQGTGRLSSNWNVLPFLAGMG